MKIQAGINKIEYTHSGVYPHSQILFTEINKIGKTLAKLNKKTEKTQNTNIKIEILWLTLCQQIWTFSWMDKFLETYNVSKYNQEEAENLNNLMSIKQIELLKQIFPQSKL